MFTLRPYQQQAVDAGIKFFKQDQYKGGLIVLPTGSGKSLVIACIAKELSGNTIVFQPSKEILEQNYAKILSYGIEDVSIYSASLGQKNISKITFATIGSVINKKEEFEHFDNIIIDESHLSNPKGGMYEEFVRHCGSKVLGLTATPYRLSSFNGMGYLKFLTRTRPRIFDKVIHYSQIKELYQYGFLAPLKYYRIPKIDTKRLRTNSTGSDYEDGSLREHLKEIMYDDEVVDIVKRLIKAGRKKVLVFTKFVEDASIVSRVLNTQGIVSEVVSGETPKKERERILDGFKDMDSKLQVITNVGVMVCGFDFPELDTIVLGRPTMSLALYYQMVGRGIRPHKNKPECWIIDMAGIVDKFGGVEDLRMKDLGNEKRVYTRGEHGKQLTNVAFT